MFCTSKHDRVVLYHARVPFQNPDEGHFDDVPSALLLLFEISTMEMWPTTLYNVVDGSAPGLRPEKDLHQGAVYCIAWISRKMFVWKRLEC